MELFSITCTTCQQRLNVRDESAIGEIQICPKCGSMVLVEAPSDWQGAPAIDEPSSASPPDQKPSTAAPVSPTEAIPEGSGQPVLPTDDWTSQATQQRRQWLLTAGAAVAGIALAIGLFGFFVSRRSGPESDVPVADAGSARDTDGSVPHDVAENAKVGKKEKTESRPSTAANSDNTKRSDDTGKPSEPPAEEGTGSKPESKPAEALGPKAVEATPDIGQAKAPKSDGEGELILEPADGEPGATAWDTAALSKTLDLLAPITGNPPSSATPPEAPPGEETPSTSVPALDAAPPAGGASAPRPKPRNVNVAERLKDPIAEIELPNVPLIDFVRFVTDFSTVPITLDPDALALVDVTPQTPVNVKLANTNVANLLAAALGALRLGYVPRDGQLLVTRPPAPDGQLRRHSHSVADLVGNDPQQLARLADMIVEMVEPDSWEVNGGVGIIRQQMPELQFEHHDVELFRAIVFCEKLRAARGLPPQSKFNPRLFRLEPRLAQAAPRLATPVTINYVQPTRFVRILDRLGKEAGLQILVDWQAAAELGWSPDGEATISANNEPVGQALAKMLLPMDLTYRVINATTLQVTSPTAVLARLEVEFYPVGRLLSPQPTPGAFVQRVCKELGEEGLREVGAAIYLDAPSQHLIAALPQPFHRELAALLDRWTRKPTTES